MYCKIQNEPLSEIIPYWQVPIDISDQKTHQFYILAESEQEFKKWYDYFTKQLNLTDTGEIEMQRRSWSINQQLAEKIEEISQWSKEAINYAVWVTSFNEVFNRKHPEPQMGGYFDSYDDKLMSSYSKSRFGHDYDQNRIESNSFRDIANNLRGKLVIFTWIDSNARDIVRTACNSQFKDGMCEPVEILE